MFKPFYHAIAPRSLYNSNGWQERHMYAVERPNAREEGIVSMLEGWFDYALRHKINYSSLIGDDGMLGPAWEEIGDALRTLLNGECGRLDCGTVDGFILHTMRENGVDTEHK